MTGAFCMIYYCRYCKGTGGLILYTVHVEVMVNVEILAWFDYLMPALKEAFDYAVQLECQKIETDLFFKKSHCIKIRFKVMAVFVSLIMT